MFLCVLLCNTVYYYVLLCAGETKYLAGESKWWIVGLVIALLALALVGILGYLKLRGKTGGVQKGAEGGCFILHFIH